MAHQTTNLPLFLQLLSSGGWMLQYITVKHMAGLQTILKFQNKLKN